MKVFEIRLNGDFWSVGAVPDRSVDILIKGNSTCLLVNNQKVTDIFYNGIQLRLYVSGSHKDNAGKQITKVPFYMIFEENCEALSMTFEELNIKLTEYFANVV